MLNFSGWKTLRAACLALAATGLLAVCAQSAEDSVLPGLESIPNVVAEVNGKPITRTELMRELVGSAGGNALDRLVRRKIVEQAAKKLNIIVTDEEIEQEFRLDTRDLAADLILTPWDKEKNFPIEDIIRARFRMSVPEYKQSVIRHKLLIQRCVVKDLNPSEDDLRKVFKNNLDYFQPPTKYHASHILISPFDPRDMHRGFAFRSAASQMEGTRREREQLDEYRRKKIDLYRDHKVYVSDAPKVQALDAKTQRNISDQPQLTLEPMLEQARKKAQDIMTELANERIKWNDAVKRYTQDPLDHPYFDKKTKRMSQKSEREELRLQPGDVGWFHKNGPLVPEFYEAAKNIPPGQYGGPVRTPYGFHLIKMIEVEQQPTLTFEQCRARVLRLYVEKYIQVRSSNWIRDQVDVAELKTERALLWPLPESGAAGLPSAGGAGNDAAKDERDPIVGRVNGEPLRRSEVWRELFRSESDEALERLTNRAVVLNMLKNLGLERLEWECAHPDRRAKQPPKPNPISINDEVVEKALNFERVRCDKLNEDRRVKQLPELSLKEFIYEQFGQSEAEYKRVLEASLILHEAIRRRVPIDDKTLRVQFYIAKENYNTPERFEASHILITPTGGMDKADSNARYMAVTTAKAVYDQLAAAPANFPKMVRDFSMDTAANKAANGRLGECVASSPESPEKEAVYREIKAQRLEAGMFTTPFAGERGYHIALLEKIHPERTADYDSVKDRVERDFLEERAKSFIDIWLRALKDPLDNPEAAKVKVFLNNEQPEKAGDPPRDNFPLPRE
jgi:parvulin-like peptidyl-prolyl isomerase